MPIGFLKGLGAKPKHSASVPPATRVYAVGDIHGRADLLDALLQQIADDARSASSETAQYLVFLGDYVDRGLNSRGVIERLLTPPLPGFGIICLKGNHEETMLDFMLGMSDGTGWLTYGGKATLLSYGVRAASEPVAMREQLRDQMPLPHLAFLEGLRLSITIGDYFFVHAGIRPDVPLDAQNANDMLWIRDEFLKSRSDYGKVVVHGHTISEKPEIKANRIGIDTGAFATGRLTCLVLEGTEQRFLST